MISSPAAAGATILVRFIPELFRATAFSSRLSGTMSETIAWRLGILNAISVPFASPITNTCQNCTTSSRSRVASTEVTTAFPVCAKMIMFLRGTRSASTPPIRDTNVIGSPRDSIASASIRGESSVSSNTSQPLVRKSMFIAMNEANELAQSHL